MSRARFLVVAAQVTLAYTIIVMEVIDGCQMVVGLRTVQIKCTIKKVAYLKSRPPGGMSHSFATKEYLVTNVIMIAN